MDNVVRVYDQARQAHATFRGNGVDGAVFDSQYHDAKLVKRRLNFHSTSVVGDLIPYTLIPHAVDCGKDKEDFTFITEFNGQDSPNCVPSPTMLTYSQEYATNRPIPLGIVTPPDMFANEYQHKKNLCNPYMFTGIVIGMTNGETDDMSMRHALEYLLNGLSAGYGYVATWHDPKLHCHVSVAKLDDMYECTVGAHGTESKSCPLNIETYTEVEDYMSHKCNIGQSDCFGYGDDKFYPGLHLHLIIWNKRGNTCPLNMNRYKELARKHPVYVKGQFMKSGSQALTYALAPPRIIAIDTGAWYRDRCNNSYLTDKGDQPIKPVLTFFLRDEGHVFSEWTRYTKNTSIAEMMFVKEEQRVEPVVEINPNKLQERAELSIAPKLKKKQTKEEANFDLFINVMEKYQITKLDHIVQIEDLMTDACDPMLAAFHTATLNQFRIRPIWESANARMNANFNQWSLQDFCDKYVKLHGIEGSWSKADNREIMSFEESLYAMEEMMKYQTGQPANRWRDEVHEWFNKATKDPKKNTLCLYGPKNSGKTWLFKPLQMMCCNHTIIGSSMDGRTSNFLFMNACNKRFIVFNETHVTPDNCDKYKELLGGEQTEVDVKHKPMQTVYRTPCVITTNHHPFFGIIDPEDRSALEARTNIKRWNEFPWHNFPKWNQKILHPACYSRVNYDMPKVNKIAAVTQKDIPFKDRVEEVLELSFAKSKAMAKLFTLPGTLTFDRLMFHAVKDVMSMIGSHIDWDMIDNDQVKDFFDHLNTDEVHAFSTCDEPVCTTMKINILKNIPAGRYDIYDYQNYADNIALRDERDPELQWQKLRMTKFDENRAFFEKEKMGSLEMVSDTEVSDTEKEENPDQA